MSVRNLQRLSYNELYKMYDETTDTSLKKKIHRIVDRKACQETDPEFQAYPDIRNPNLQDILFKKKEFHSNQLILDTTQQTSPCGAEFSIKEHQIFLKNFMTKETPYRSLLVYHGVGVGKTCSGLTVAENFRDIYADKQNRILILCSSNIQIGWKQTIYTPEKQTNQCTGDTYTDSGASTKRQVNKLIKQYYEIMAYQSFSNYVNRMIAQYIAPYPADQKESATKECIHKYFSNRLMIIDEVHNIRDDQGGEMRDTLKTIQRVIRYSDNLRLLLLTATPMYNRSTEIIWILNMMLLNDKRSLLNKEDIFDDTGTLTESGSEILQNVSRGYISYLRGENPITFPIRIYPSSLKQPGRSDSVYLPYQRNPVPTVCLINSDTAPIKNLVGGRIQNKLKFLDLLGSKMSGLQSKIYSRSIQQLLENTPDLDINLRGDVNPILDNIMLTQISNIVYPLDVPDMDDLQNHYGPLGLKRCMVRRGSKYSYSPKVVREHGYFFDKDIIQGYSTKIKTIIDSIDNSEGIVFVYTNYVDSGIVPLKLALEQNGYVNHSGFDSLDLPDYNPRLQGKCKREPISYDGKRKSETDTFQQATFMVIDGSTNQKRLQQQLSIVSSIDNQAGQKIKVILGTVVASEGLDFKRIRSIHILDPWPHLNRMEQTVGRGIRFCSHTDLDEVHQNVTIYLHTTTLQKGWESIDTSIYRYAERKSLQIGDVETILKQSAVDRYLYRDVNVIGKNRIKNMLHQPALRQSKEIAMDVSDKKYSKVCSYQRDCDYNQTLQIDDDFGVVNEDTFMDIYSRPSLEIIKKKIAILYREFIVYDIDSMMGLLDEYGNNNPDIIYQALSEMLDDRYTVYDRSGNSGYIVQKHKYYVFQPLLYDDSTIPLYYRKNILVYKKPTLYLERFNDTIIQALTKYDDTQIKDAYDTLESMIQNKETQPDLKTILEGLEIVNSNYALTPSNVMDDRSVCKHPAVIAYCFDRLTFHQKCSLLFAYFTKSHFPDYVAYEPLQSIIQSMILCKRGSNYSLKIEPVKKQDKTSTEDIGFFIVVNQKPQYYEFYNGLIVPFNAVRLAGLQRGIKQFTKSATYKQFIKTPPIWGYSVIRNNGKECVMKISQSKETKQFPPGPGNVCVDNNLASHKDVIKGIFHKLYDNSIQTYLESGVPDTRLSKEDTVDFAMSALIQWMFPKQSTRNKDINHPINQDILQEKQSIMSVVKDIQLHDSIQTKLLRYFQDNLLDEDYLNNLDKKQNLCALLELLFRSENDNRITYYYSSDLIWLKYI